MTDVEAGATPDVETPEGGANEGAAAGKAAAPSDSAAKARAADGKFAKAEAPAEKSAEPVTSDWREGLDGELKEFAARMATPHDAVKSAYDLRKEISARIKVPGKDASDEDWAKFRAAIGVPAKAEDYKFALPEGREASETDTAFQQTMAQIFHETGVPAATAEKLNARWNEMQVAMEAEAERVAVSKREEAASALKRELGADYEPHLKVAERAARVFGGEEFLNLVNDVTYQGGKLGDHPLFLKVFGAIGRRMGEAQFIGAVGSEDKQSLRDEIDRLFREYPPGTDKGRDPGVQKRLRELHEQLYGTGPISGGFGSRAI